MPDFPTPSCALDAFAEGSSRPSPLRQRITDAYRLAEVQALPPLLDAARLPEATAVEVNGLARRLAQTLRQRKASAGRAGLVQGLLQEYALSSQEGVALMCLAEALLRIPDKATRDALIRDKIAKGEWQSHTGQSPSVFVNAATWGLLLTGKLVATHSEAGLSALLGRLIGKGGEPLIRKGVDMAMRMMGEQFVTGETIAQALERAKDLEPQGFRYSYDMLGEAAMTAHDAQRYRQSYEDAIHAIGRASNGRGVLEGPGISIKLSALHPRYSRAQHGRVMAELYPVLCELTMLARRYDIGINIDAEEADRLELSLDLLERLCFEPALAGWNGIGFVLQAYQKRCVHAIDHVIDLGRRSGHRLMVRLVKGAYWDSEIKRAQVDGQDGFPVFSRKAYTDVSYLACARRLLAAPDAVYPQFATHNAHTLAAVYTMAGPATYTPGQYEFQCLHGMGEPLYEQVAGAVEAGKLGRPCRIYAPVGTHETLLAYLVRRLLENGANTSFVHRIADPTIGIDMLVEDPVATVDRMASSEGRPGLPHPSIAAPVELYGAGRRNSRGIDLSDENTLRQLGDALAASARAPWTARPLLGSAPEGDDGAARAWQQVVNPADHRDVVGRTMDATVDEVVHALDHAQAVAVDWAATTPSHRAELLDATAALMEARLPQLLGLLSREAGKTLANGIAEVREAVDFLRFYAAQARSDFSNATHVPLGPVVCISPWNFPLAIFMGQVAAALAAGNPVLAKPAEQTPLVAAEAVRLLWEAGVPRAVVQLLPGRGETVGAALVADHRVQGVVFTGSTAVARILQAALATRLGASGQPVPLIAETGGQNAMIVDSSALVEQVVGDVMASAFDSAGQRCSALRVLCVQEDVADRVVEMLRGAMAEACVGNPARLATDIGPVIDVEAQAGIEAHIANLRAKGRTVYRHGRTPGDAMARGTFVAPTLIALESLADLTHEVFGPVLHLLRYRRADLGALLERINALGYGLTLGLHTRIDETIEQVVTNANVGNLYVNRNMVGAVVGVQPFGGEGLSGTGPKAGGPLYMHRLLAARPDDVLARVFGDAASDAEASSRQAGTPRLDALAAWASERRQSGLVDACRHFSHLASNVRTRVLAGPTGERNLYSLLPRRRVLCLAGDDVARLNQLAAVLAVGSQALWPAGDDTEALRAMLPVAVQPHVVLAQDWQASSVEFDVVLHHGSRQALESVVRRVADRKGPIVCVRACLPNAAAIPLEALVVERSVSINTAAAGGNASLMTMD